MVFQRTILCCSRPFPSMMTGGRRMSIVVRYAQYIPGLTIPPLSLRDPKISGSSFSLLRRSLALRCAQPSVGNLPAALQAEISVSAEAVAVALEGPMPAIPLGANAGRLKDALVSLTLSISAFLICLFIWWLLYLRLFNNYIMKETVGEKLPKNGDWTFIYTWMPKKAKSGIPVCPWHP